MPSKKNEWENRLKADDPTSRENFAEFLGRKKNDLEAPTFLATLLKDSNSFVRSAALKSLKQINQKKIFSKVLPLLKDKDELVRVDAIECLSTLDSKKSIQYLINMLNDRSEIVRGYIGSAVGEIGDKSFANYLEKRLKKERLGLAKVGILEGLYRLGREERLVEIIDSFKSKRYQVRCCVANTLSALANKNNKILIEKSLLKVLRDEPTAAARSSMKNALKL